MLAVRPWTRRVLFFLFLLALVALFGAFEPEVVQVPVVQPTVLPLPNTPVRPQNPLRVCESVRPAAVPMCLEALDATPLGPRTPLIFVHGWNTEAVPAPPAPEQLDNLAGYLTAIPWVPEKFKFYRLDYPSNAVSVRSLGRFMAIVMSDMDAKDPAFSRKKSDIAAYSLGVLVSRSFSEENYLRGSLAGESVLKLVSLAGPNHGTPAANGPARDAKSGFWAGLFHLFDYGLFNSNLTWSTDDRYQLHWDNYDGMLDYRRFPSGANLWLRHLNESGRFQNELSVYAGTVQSDEDSFRCLSFNFGCLAAVLNLTLGVKESDGIVPLASADFDGCKGCEHHPPLAGYDHLQMAEGKSARDSNLFGLVVRDLSKQAAPGDSRFNNYVYFGDFASEEFHNLRNWGALEGNTRSLPTDLPATVDLFTQPPSSYGRAAAPYELLVTFRNGPCDDSFNVETAGQVVGRFDDYGRRSSLAVGLPARLVTGNLVTLSFLNRSSDGCGSAAVSSVSLFR